MAGVIHSTHPNSRAAMATRVMAVNYRCEPIIERGGDPAFWFLSRPHQYEVSDPVDMEPRRRDDVDHGDPSTDVFHAYAGDPVRLRLFQGSHEEQHSLQVHGMRWRQYALDASAAYERPDPKQPVSPWRNQQTIGISEAFTFVLDQRYSRGDHLWKFSAADDLWLGCWGLIRVHGRGEDHPLLRLPQRTPRRRTPRPSAQCRHRPTIGRCGDFA